MATLINGNGNTPVTAQQDADLYQGILGGDFVKMLPVGSQMAYTIEDANTISLADGECVDSEGRRIHIDVGYTDSFTIPTGTSLETSYYIIGYEIVTDSGGNETAETFVEEVDSATATIDEGSLRSGDSDKYVSLYRVTQESLTITDVEALFTTVIGVAEGLPFGFAVQDDTYGYIDSDGAFHSFRSATGTATAARVLSGYTFSNASSDNITGTMNNWGANTVTMASNTATLSAGYYSSVSINAASRYSSGYSAAKVGNATAARVLSGYTFTNSGTVNAAGTMNNWGSNTVNLSSSNTATLSAGYYSSITVNCASRYSNAVSATYTTINGYTWAISGTGTFSGYEGSLQGIPRTIYANTMSGTVKANNGTLVINLTGTSSNNNYSNNTMQCQLTIKGS